MTAAVISSLPFQAGGALAASAGRGALWVVALYMRQPLRNTGIAALIGFSALAGSNALYFQHHRHPAPLFGVVDQQPVAAEVEPVVPAVRRSKAVLPATSNETTGSVDAQSAPRAVSNDEVLQLQRKLQALKLLDGTADGMFGPHTSKAVRAFEVQEGRKPAGQLTPQIVALIMAAPIAVEATKIETMQAPDPVPMAAADDAPSIAAPEPLPAASTEESVPLPTPEPLPLTIERNAMQPVAEARVDVGGAVTPTRELPGTPQEALDVAMNTAGDAIDTIVNGVQTMTMTKPNGGTVQKRTVQTLPIKAAPLPVAEAPQTTTVADLGPASTNPAIVSNVQRGLSSLGFLHGNIDGVAGEATAKAIRNFEVYYNYNVTGQISPELVNLLVQNGAVI